MWSSLLCLLVCLACSIAFPNIPQHHPHYQALRRPDKRARYLDTYIVKNTEVHYHLPNQQAQYTQQLAQQNNENPLVSFYQVQKNAYPLMNQRQNPSQQMYYLPQGGGQLNIPSPDNNQGASSAVAQSCTSAICVNMRSGFNSY